MLYPKLLATLVLLLLQFLLGCSAPGTGAQEPQLVPGRSLPTGGLDFNHGASAPAPASASTGDASALELVIASDFRKGTSGWTANYAGYPEDMSELIDFHGGVSASPDSREKSRTFAIRGTNAPATLFLYLVRSLEKADGLEPNRTYEIRANLRFVSGASSQCMGPGGSPGQVALYAGAFAEEPTKMQDEHGAWHLTPDPFEEADRYYYVDVIDNGRPCRSDLRDFVSVSRSLSQPFRAETDANGRLHIVVGVSGGFAGETAVYFENIELQLTKI